MTRRAADTSNPGACQETPPRGVEMPVSRFAISENFSGMLPYSCASARPPDDASELINLMTARWSRSGKEVIF
jgi:hypothetical protein